MKHSDYAAIEQLSKALQNKLTGFSLHDAFSTNKSELLLVFVKGEEFFTLKLIVEAGTFFLFFYEYPFERGGSVYPLFTYLAGKAIVKVNQHKTDRVFHFLFDDTHILLIKLYGPLANVALLHGGKVTQLFRQNIKKDWQISLAGVEVSDLSEVPVLKEFCFENSTQTYTNIFEAYNEFGKSYLAQFNFEQKKRVLVENLKKELAKTQKNLANSQQSLVHAQTAIKPSEIADIIMANLHQLKQGIIKAELFDFYRNENITIKLNKNLSPQQNAEHLYKKGKNSKMDVEQIRLKVKNFELRIEGLKEKIELLEKAESAKDLKAFEKSASSTKKPKQESLFKEFEFEGYTILVGKSAANNDLLTLKHAHKEDLWLHAKGVSGSHVVVKHQPKKDFAKPVIEYAARLAAYYSKAKGSTWVPVIYTLKKCVRKPKGAEPGAVLVEKEEVILVEPKQKSEPKI